MIHINWVKTERGSAARETEPERKFIQTEKGDAFRKRKTHQEKERADIEREIFLFFQEVLAYLI